MALQEPARTWLRTYKPRRIINAPAGNGRDIPFLEGVLGSDVLNVEAQISLVLALEARGHRAVLGDLRTWRPPSGYDAAFVNGIFASAEMRDSRRDLVTAAENLASWDVDYIVLYDSDLASTSASFVWIPAFRGRGWLRFEGVTGPDSPSTRQELWARPDAERKAVPVRRAEFLPAEMAPAERLPPLPALDGRRSWTNLEDVSMEIVPIANPVEITIRVAEGAARVELLREGAAITIVSSVLEGTKTWTVDVGSSATLKIRNPRNRPGPGPTAWVSWRCVESHE